MRYGFRVLLKTNEQEDKDESKQKYFFIGRKTASPGIQRPPFPHGLQRKGSIPGALQRADGTAYDNPDDLTVTTLENAIYMGMRNDVSYLLYDRLALYEHQASINPNMPLRNLFYVSDIYSGLTKDSNLYGSKLVRLPEPQFVVFYNGADELPERSILRLSDAFSHKGGEPKLELEVLVLNINPGSTWS